MANDEMIIYDPLGELRKLVEEIRKESVEVNGGREKKPRQSKSR